MRKWIVVTGLVVAAAAARAERGGIGTTAEEQAGVDIEESVLGPKSIKMVRTRFVDPGAIFDEDGAGVVSLGRKRPEGKHVGTPDKKIGFDDKAPPVPDQKLTDPFPTGVRFGGVDGLMQSQNDSSGNVAKISIPGDPPTTLSSPQKMDGSPLTQKDLMDLGQGRVKQIQLKDGRVLGSPSSPQSG